jgi:hypothetical protein
LRDERIQDEARDLVETLQEAQHRGVRVVLQVGGLRDEGIEDEVREMH